MKFQSYSPFLSPRGESIIDFPSSPPLPLCPRGKFKGFPTFSLICPSVREENTMDLPSSPPFPLCLKRKHSEPPSPLRSPSVRGEIKKSHLFPIPPLFEKKYNSFPIFTPFPISPKGKHKGFTNSTLPEEKTQCIPIFSPVPTLYEGKSKWYPHLLPHSFSFRGESKMYFPSSLH